MDRRMAAVIDLWLNMVVFLKKSPLELILTLHSYASLPEKHSFYALRWTQL